MGVILFADDSMSIRLFVNNALKKHGYKVLLAEDGINALEILRNNKGVDLLLTDYNMPNMDGFQLASETRKILCYKFLPILIITTEGRSIKKLEAKECGATGWITKPFNEELLVKSVNKVIRN